MQKGYKPLIEVTIYSSHLIIAAKKTWPTGGWIIEVPLYTFVSCVSASVPL